MLGAPNLPDFPLATRAREPVTTASLDTLVAQVEAHLEKNPTDGRGWQVLAPVLEKIGRLDDAVGAFRNAIAYNGEDSASRADLGEAIVVAANGVVTAEAKQEFERAVALGSGQHEGSLFPWACRGTGWPRQGRRRNMGGNACRGPCRCSLAARGAGRARAGRPPRRAPRSRIGRYRLLEPKGMPVRTP